MKYRSDTSLLGLRINCNHHKYYDNCPAPNVIKLFKSVKARAFQVEHLKEALRYAPGLAHKHKTRLERLVRDKHSSLLQALVNYGCKMFYRIGCFNSGKRDKKVFIVGNCHLYKSFFKTFFLFLIFFLRNPLFSNFHCLQFYFRKIFLKSG